ncbi:MAG: hypothetical protein AAGA66_13375, partial [Bacteroidota bacterium]
NDELIEEEFKDLGTFDYSEFNGPVLVTLRHFNEFDYTLSFRFYTKKIDKREFSKRSYYLAGKEVNEEVLFLFKPDEIVLKPIFTSYSYSPNIEIFVKKSDHPIIKYYESEGGIFYENILYPHGKIPKIIPNTINSLEFIDKWNSGDTLIPVLVLSTFKSSSNDREAISLSYDIETPEVKFVKIGNQVLTIEALELEKINLEEDYDLIKTVFGKEAVDEFGHSFYSQGVGIYELK